MSAHGMSEAGGLREALEALTDRFMAQGCHHRHQQGETNECNACTASDFAALLAAHPAPEADPTAGDASTSASEPLSEDVEALAKVLAAADDTVDARYCHHVAEQILASDWLAAREAKARAEAGEQALQEAADAYPFAGQGRLWLRDRADRIDPAQSAAATEENRP